MPRRQPTRSATDVTTVGIVGLGLLGHAVASRLLAAGHEVIGFDVLAGRVAAVSALGGKAVKSAAEVAQHAELVCTLLPSLQTVEEAILGEEGVLAGAHAGQVVAQMSTISPALTRQLAREVSARELSFLDCPVSGTSGMVARGEGVLFVGGERDVFERCRSALAAILPDPVYVGAAGQAMALNLVANLLVGLHSAAAAEALVLAQKSGLDLDLVVRVLGAGAGGSRMLEVRGPMMVQREFPAQMKLELFMKDLHLIQDAAASVGAPLPLTDVAERLYAAAFASGHGDEDLSVVVTALESHRDA